MRFPSGDRCRGYQHTSLDLDDTGVDLPVVTWAGHLRAGAEPIDALPGRGPGMPMLGEHSQARFTRPHLRGHRLRDDGGAGSDWTTRFVTIGLERDDDRLRLTAGDPHAGLSIVLDLESVAGGSLRGRWTLINDGTTPYVVDGLEVVLPVADHLTETLDFTGRHERERSPQRRPVTDGLWLREGRGGRPGLDAASMMVIGTPGFTTTSGEVLGVHVAWSGNSVLRVERDASTGTTIGGGELLLPGEIVLDPGDSYATPWVFFGSAEDGLDGLAASWHTWQRSLPAHPAVQPMVLNVWEAVYFDHDLDRLKAIADRGARVGVERFVLDDGWFRHRRDDTAGLGDWWTDETVWPDGLTPLIEHVHGLGLEFGLWFEPEMVNPDSDLMRQHPDWILSAGPHRAPREHRNQQVLDLSRDEVSSFLYDRMSQMLTDHPIDYIKWDHNRDLLEAGSRATGGRPSVHNQTVAFHRLLDALREAFPAVAWESCASGGGRIDFSVLERVQRTWISDMTDALARQLIQRWSVQLLAPEYLGAHVSSPTSHTTGRTLSIDFRCATALFGAFGIEWDLTGATEGDLVRLADWVERHRRFRDLLHSGRVVRPESSDPSVLLHGVVAQDGSEGLLAHVTMDESTHNRGVWLRVPGLPRDARYRLSWEGPIGVEAVSMSQPLHPDGPAGGEPMTGDLLGTQGFWVPRRRPESVVLTRLQRV